MNKTSNNLQNFGAAGYLYRGVSIDHGRGSRNRKIFRVNVTKLVTDQYRANFYDSIDQHVFIADTLTEAVNTIDNMFDNGDLA